ncbi:MAG: L-aspartate oxidase [Acidobacteria bacterium]|nr:L-aspartate oxidase [Acidobacteriota bacterium]
MHTRETDVLILGSGLAGCSAAIAAARRGARVLMLTKTPRAEESNTWYAQGGIIYRGRTDSPEQLGADILAAGDGLCNPAAVELLALEGPRLVDEVLIRDAGVPFDVADDGTGALDLTAEAAHSMARIVHRADGTGRSVEDAMLALVRRQPGIELLTGQTAIDLLTLSHHSRNPLDIYAPLTCVGAYVFDQATRRVETVMARETILATGGLGRIFLHTSNPAGACGDGVSMAYRAGARCINMPYVQFHPTTLFVGEDRFLISESLRGEGAKLVDERGREFMRDYHPDGSLAPRDVVARGIHQMMHETGASCAYLDISHKPAAWIRSRFPRIHERCREAGIDITVQPIPVVPAAHYSCGGVAVDGLGRSSLHRLYAVGEVSCTGLHGANRLASTSLLECLVWGTRAGDDAAAAATSGERYYLPDISPWQHETEQVDPALVAQDWLTIRHTMWNYVGLVRSRKRLDRAHQILRELHLEIGRFYAQSELSDALIGLRHGIQAALVVLLAAIETRTSAGCHYRID